MVGEYTPGPWKRCGLETVMLDELGIDLQDGCADFEAVGVSEGPDLNLLVALVPPALGEDGWPLADNPNLALILAAPDLLAAAREMRNTLDGIWRGCLAVEFVPAKNRAAREAQNARLLARFKEQASSAYEKGKAAIAKAEGR